MSASIQKIQDYAFQSKERFLRYVQIDTQSDPHSETVPSTSKQMDLANLLADELRSMGIKEVHLDEKGYVYAHLPSNLSYDVDGLLFCSHMDTSPDCSGNQVKPLIHPNYQGQDLILPLDPSVRIRLQDHPDLKEQIGNDIITASGDTLLGADNKAGLATIMDAVQCWVQNPDLAHGPIDIVFTPDEEIGRGTDHIDLKRIQAKFGFTIDGERRGQLEIETFSADGAVLKIHGVSQHPGFAKGRMESALKIAAKIIEALPSDTLCPEHTEEKQGFIHPCELRGSVEYAEIQFILRDFDTHQLQRYGELIQEKAREVLKFFPNSRMEYQQTEQYRNMYEVVKQHPKLMELAEKAIARAGLQAHLASVRGGTDGSRLTFMGIPCPNLFAGEHAFHSKQEWVSVQDMQKSTEVILHLVDLWSKN